MGRGRKKQYIKTFTSKDKEMLRAFRNCGRLSDGHLKNNLAMADRRIINFQRDGYVEKVKLLNLKTKGMDTVYQLTDKGRLAVESHLNLKHCYRSVGGRHDLAIANKYFALTENERKSWQTESQLRELFQEKYGERGDYAVENKEMSATDGAYITKSGHYISFEVVTKHYGETEIRAKENFAEALGMHLEISKI